MSLRFRAKTSKMRGFGRELFRLLDSTVEHFLEGLTILGVPALLLSSFLEGLTILGVPCLIVIRSPYILPHEP